MHFLELSHKQSLYFYLYSIPVRFNEMHDVVQQKVQDIQFHITGKKKAARKNSAKSMGKSKPKKHSSTVVTSDESKDQPKIATTIVPEYEQVDSKVADSQSIEMEKCMDTLHEKAPKACPKMSSKEQDFMSQFERNFAKLAFSNKLIRTNKSNKNSLSSLKSKSPSHSSKKLFNTRCSHDFVLSDTSSAKSKSSSDLQKKELKFKVINFNSIQCITVEDVALSETMPEFQAELDKLHGNCQQLSSLDVNQTCLVSHHGTLLRAVITGINNDNGDILVRWIDRAGMATVSVDR